MRKLCLFILLSALSCFGQGTLARVPQTGSGWCQLGGQKAVTQGLNSTNEVQRSFPQCTVTVYFTGTSNLATIYLDNNTPPTPLSNPFTANTNGSFGFFAPNGCYDIVNAGGNTGDQFPQPFTYTDVCVGTGGGGGGVNPGTPYQVTRYDPTGTNIQNSSGSDNPANGPTRWVSGLSVEGNAGYRFFVNSPTGTAVNLLVCRDTTVTTLTEVTTCPTSSNSVFGIADNGAGLTGNVRVAMIGFHPCVFDGSTTVGDWVIPSTTVAGDCSDAGGSKPTNAQVLGHVTTLNTGAGTLATVDLWTGDTISGGGAPVTVVPCSIVGCDAYYSATNVISGDNQTNDDGLGHKQAKSLGLTDSTYAGYLYQTAGPQPPAPPAGSIEEYPPTSVSTPYSEVRPGAGGSVGQTRVIQSTGTDSNGHPILVETWGTAGGSGFPEIQTNGTDNSNCTAGACPLLNNANGTPSFGFQVTPSNTTGGTTVYNINTPFIAASDPSAPTATVTNAGSTDYKYAIIACADAGCTTYHSKISTVTDVPNGNATLSGSNTIKLSGYGDTLYGYRYFTVCRTSSSGTPATTGIIAKGVGKVFVDTGLTADGSNCATNFATNTTRMEVGTSAYISCASPIGSPQNIEGPPCSPNALDDEFNWNGLNSSGSAAFTPGDANDPQYGTMNSPVVTMVGSEMVLTASVATNNVRCVYVTAPATPYYFKARVFYNDLINGRNEDQSIGAIGAGLGLSDGTKLTIIGLEAIPNTTNGRVTVGKWSTTTTANAIAAGGVTESTLVPIHLAVQDDGTNVAYYTSTDGITYIKQFTETRGTFFSTGPTRVVMCMENDVGQNYIAFDYLRQRSSLP